MSSYIKEYILEDYNIAIQLVRLEDHWAEFRVFDVHLGYDSEIKEYLNPTSNTSGFKDANQAIPIITGYVKWDGCSNLSFYPDIHFCGLRDINKLSKSLEEIYKIAKKEIKNWNGDD